MLISLHCNQWINFIFSAEGGGGGETKFFPPLLLSNKKAAVFSLLVTAYWLGMSTVRLWALKDLILFLFAQWYPKSDCSKGCWEVGVLSTCFIMHYSHIITARQCDYTRYFLLRAYIFLLDDIYICSPEAPELQQAAPYCLLRVPRFSVLI